MGSLTHMCVSKHDLNSEACAPIMHQLDLYSIEKLPAQNSGGLYKANCVRGLRSWRGLSVPFTVSVHGEPCSSGRTGHASVKLRRSQDVFMGWRWGVKYGG